MAATMLTGCSFFKHNNERDYRQVAAEIKSYEITNTVRNDDDEPETKVYKTQKRTIYKYDLVEYVNNNYSSLSQSASTAKGIIEAAMEMLVDTELVINEADALIDAGLVKWGITERNNVKKQIYSVIDSTILSIENEILDERDKPHIETDSDSSDAETTYPVKPVETDEDYTPEDTVEWEPELINYPGLSGDSEKRSLESEALRRFISLLYDRVKDDFRVTDEDRKKFDADKKLIENTINTKGISYVYPILGDTHYMYYISGKNIERSFKINALKDYLTDSVTVSDEEVYASYRSMLNMQTSSFSQSAAAFDSAMSAGNTVLFYPNDDYFYVKHILLPFSDAQTAELKAYKERAGVTEAQIEGFRRQLAAGIVCYPHVNGEDDLSHPMTVDEVMGEIRAKMLPLQDEDDTRLANLAFDDLIYKYNTDPGAFDNNKGYVVKNSKDGNSYMEEFTDAALYMRKNLKVGDVYYEKVITDYGVHIMYFADTTKVGAVDLYDYTTPGKVEQYYDLIAEPIRTTRENARYSTWEAEILNYNYKKQATLYKDRYSDLWED